MLCLHLITNVIDNTFVLHHKSRKKIKLTEFLKHKYTHRAFQSSIIVKYVNKLLPFTNFMISIRPN